MSEFFSAVIAAATFVKTTREIFDRMVVLYVQRQIAILKKEDREAIRKALDEQDQRDLEKQLGNPTPGNPSGIPGTELRDSLPGVDVPPPDQG